LLFFSSLITIDYDVLHTNIVYQMMQYGTTNNTPPPALKTMGDTYRLAIEQKSCFQHIHRASHTYIANPAAAGGPSLQEGPQFDYPPTLKAMVYL
jgi:hypothetical protein